MENVYLLIKYYLKETSKEETSYVLEWLNSNNENQKAYEDFIRIWYHSKLSAKLSEVNPQEAWNKIVAETAIQKRKNFSVYYRIAAAAAVVFFILFLTIKPTPQQLIVSNETRGSIKEVLLPDSTKVFLSYKSKIEYPSSFSDEKRMVELKGRAYFEVKRDTKRPFSIKTMQSRVNVLGTSFDCFATDSVTSVFVNTGRVSLVNTRDTSQFAVLLPGDLGKSYSQIVMKKKAMDDNILSWKTGIFQFQNTALAKVFTKLEERFHIPFNFNEEEIKDKVITVSFNNNLLEDILDVIQHTSSVSFDYNTNSTIINVYPKN